MKSQKIAEYGDFQTPNELAFRVAQIVKSHDVFPSTIIEPTCGKGNFIAAAIETFPGLEKILGLEINRTYFSDLKKYALGSNRKQVLDFRNADFFPLTGMIASKIFMTPSSLLAILLG